VETTTRNKHFHFKITGPDQTNEADAATYVRPEYQISRPKLRESAECLRDQEVIPLAVQNRREELEPASNRVVEAVLGIGTASFASMVLPQRRIVQDSALFFGMLISPNLPILL
jgi:hypothetical protein